MADPAVGIFSISQERPVGGFSLALGAARAGVLFADFYSVDVWRRRWTRVYLFSILVPLELSLLR